MERLACKLMLTRLGWSDAASSLMYDDQAINSIDEFISLDNELVETLCKVLLRPGDVMATGDPGPGVKVNARYSNNLMLAVYFINNKDRFSRDVTFRNVILAGVRKLAGQHEMEEYYTEGSVTTPKVHTNDWSKTLEGVEEYLRTLCGLNSSPLSYVVRKNIVPTAEADDP